VAPVVFFMMNRGGITFVQTVVIHYVDSFGVPVDYVNHERVDYKTLPTMQHPVDKDKYAKIQKPFFVANVGYFIFFKTCDRNGKIKDGTKEYVKCICKNGVFKCNWHKKNDQTNGDYSHPCSAPVPRSSSLKDKTSPQSPGSLPNIAKSKMQEVLMEKHIDLVLDANISFTKATSARFYDFVHTAMEFARRNPFMSVKEIFRKIDRTTLSREVKSSGESRLSGILKWLGGNGGKAVSVVLDAGFKGRRDFVVALLLLPYFDIKPIFFALFVCAGTRVAYAELGAKIISSLSAHGVRVVSFCTDGLKHQVLSLTMNSAQCFNHHLPSFFAVFYSPCLCHRIHLAYNDVLKYCVFLSSQLSSVNDMVVFLRKKNIRTTIALMCPATVKTRWVFIVRVLQWLIIHYEQFSSVLDGSFISLNELKVLFLLFLPLFILVCIFERNRSSVEMVYSLIISAVRFYARLEQVPSISGNPGLLQSVQCLSFFLLRRTLDSPNQSAFITSFILSPLGRFHIVFIIPMAS
jgi:hypothetical protein